MTMITASTTTTKLMVTTTKTTTTTITTTTTTCINTKINRSLKEARNFLFTDIVEEY